MKAKFKVKNFGPIVNAELDLRNVNVFIGPQASGKSTLAKLYAICKSPSSYLINEGEDSEENGYFQLFNKVSDDSFETIKFRKVLQELNIESYLNSKSIVEYDSQTHYFKYSQGKIDFKWKLRFNEDIINYEELIQFVKDYSLVNSLFSFLTAVDVYKEVTNKIDYEYFEITKLLKYGLLRYIKDNKISFDYLKKSVKFSFKYCESLLLGKTLYIPAERIIVSIIKGASLNLQRNDVPIPKHLLNFAAAYEKVQIKSFDLTKIGMEDSTYKNISGVDKIYLSKRKSILLSEAATGFQSVIPLILTVLDHSNISTFSSPSFVIEEPEISLYPKAQYELIKFLESQRNDDSYVDTTYINTYTTHSPYILASFNNMLFAFKKSKEFKANSEKLQGLKNILPENNWLNPDNFNAYTIKDGKAFKIFNRKMGLIDDNIIDDVSDDLNDDFDKIMEI